MSLRQPKLFDKAVGAIYEAAVDESAFPSALELIAQLSGASAASYARVEKATNGLVYFHQHGHDPHTHQVYQERFWQIDPGLPAAVALRLGEWLIDETAFDPKMPSHREFAHDFAFRHNIRWLSGTKVIEDADAFTYISLQRPLGSPGFRETGRKELEPLMHHLRRAALIHERMRVSVRDAQLAHATLDRLRAAACILGRSGHVVHANSAALSLFSSRQPLLLYANRLIARDAELSRRLEHAIASATSTPPVASALSWRDCRSGELIQLQVTPLPPCGPLSGSGHEPFALLMASMQAPSAHSVEVISALFGLTAAEAKLVAALAQGESLAQIQARTLVKIGTLRTQLAAAFTKTGTTSQVQLVAVIKALPALEP